MENSSRNKKNVTTGVMCSRNKDKHTDEEGWTAIDVNGNRKPKMMNNKQPIIDTINIEKKVIKKEAAKAIMELPTRENRYTLTKEVIRQETDEIASTRI